VWKCRNIREKLNLYYRVMINEIPAKFILARRLNIDIDSKSLFNELTFKDLWSIHERAKKEFAKLFKDIQESKDPWKEVPKEEPKQSFLDVKIELARRLSSPCHLCERRCGVNRLKGKIGTCRVKGIKPCVDTYFLHMGEESPLVPSGTIFYLGCNFRCVYCQNWTISQIHGIPESFCITPKELAEIQDSLRLSGARNINHVGGEPTPHIPGIIESMKYIKTNVPQLWNSNMYLTEEAISILEDLIDIWLPDFKYGNDRCALKLSAVPKYTEVVKRNIQRAVRSGNMIVRHLILPNHVECCTKPIVNWLAKNVPEAVLNIMDQYYPDYLVRLHPRRWADINRRISRKEYDEAVRAVRNAGYEGPCEGLWYLP